MAGVVIAIANCDRQSGGIAGMSFCICDTSNFCDYIVHSLMNNSIPDLNGKWTSNLTWITGVMIQQIMCVLINYIQIRLVAQIEQLSNGIFHQIDNYSSNWFLSNFVTSSRAAVAVAIVVITKIYQIPKNWKIYTMPTCEDLWTGIEHHHSRFITTVHRM